MNSNTKEIIQSCIIIIILNKLRWYIVNWIYQLVVDSVNDFNSSIGTESRRAVHAARARAVPRSELIGFANFIARSGIRFEIIHCVTP